jgi:hypothetical protein
MGALVNSRAGGLLILFGSSTRCRFLEKENVMLTILIVIAVLLALGALPAWPHSRNWGYYPSGGLGLVLLILVVLVLSGRL